MTIDPTKLVFVAPANATAGSDTYGGAPATLSEMTSDVDGNEFADVTNEQRISGLIDYRKQYLYNKNTDPWVGIKAWISENTPSEDDEITVCGAGRYSMLNTATSITTIPATHLSNTIIQIPSVVPINAVAPGEHVFDWDNDPSMENHREVVSVATDGSSNTLVTISASFGSATGTEFYLGITPATMFTYAEHASKASGIYFETIEAGGCAGVWKRREVNADSSGYYYNTLKMRWESE